MTIILYQYRRIRFLKTHIPNLSADSLLEGGVRGDRDYYVNECDLSKFNLYLNNVSLSFGISLFFRLQWRRMMKSSTPLRAYDICDIII